MPVQVGKVLEKEEIRRLAKEKLNEIPERREQDIHAIRKWIKQQPHLKKHGKTGKQYFLYFFKKIYCFNIILIGQYTCLNI